jgi:hypothetical protein
LAMRIRSSKDKVPGIQKSPRDADRRAFFVAGSLGGLFDVLFEKMRR